MNNSRFMFSAFVSFFLITMSAAETSDLETLFSPSKWSKRFGPEEVIQHHIKFVTEASARALKSIPHQLNIPYGESEREKLDIFGTDLPDDSPIFIYIHGGYWQMLNKELSSYPVEPLYKNGYRVIVIGYDLCPAVTLEQIIQEIQKAFNYCFNYAKSHKSKHIFIGGHSAGAHLTLSIFTTKFSAKEKWDMVKGVYLISGIFDLLPLVNTTVNKPLKLDESSAKRLSVVGGEVSGLNKDVAFKVIVGENDSPSFKQQAGQLQRNLHANGWDAELIVLDKLDHFDIVEKLNEEGYSITQMIINM